MSDTTRRLVCSIVLAGSLTAACSKRTPPAPAAPPRATVEAPAPVAPPPAPAVQPVQSPAQPAQQPAPLTEAEIFARKTLAELNAERPLGDAFFDYDQSTIRDDARPVLQANAQWLTKWPSTRITLEGHSDERGTAEYNLALGERRANAVRGYLASLGVAPDRIHTVGLGKESPFCVERIEPCFQQNRRGHFIISAK